MNSMTFVMRCLVSAFVAAVTVHAQGPLIPPGPPGPTMKTLAQVEPRTPIESLPYFITNSGSYYLTKALVGTAMNVGISIVANNVTIDLNGFSVSGASVGIYSPSTGKSVAVRNGSVFGCVSDGIDLGLIGQCLVEQVVVSGNGANGLRVGEGSMIRNSQASGNGAAGIVAGESCTVSHCIARTNSAEGIRIGGEGYVQENICDHNGSAPAHGGIVVVANGTRVEANHVSFNTGAGIKVSSQDNLVIKNSARGNTVTDYVISSGNNYGQIIYSPGANFVVANAWANFSSSCAPGQTLCGGSCISTNNDVNNCGACNTVCPTHPNMAASCQNGACTYACDPGYADCDATLMDGCEVYINGDVNNCGGCGIACAAGQSCQNGMCVNNACMTDAQCPMNQFCQASMCVPKFAVGQACMGNYQCVSGICMNGVCQSNTDSDGDGVPDAIDNCPTVPNANQADADADGVGDVCDNCPNVSNPNQADANMNGIGDACEASCANGIKDGSETGVDCGGPNMCPRCAVGIQCAAGSDCITGACSGGVCVATAEMCDGIDNNGNGQIDEGLGTSTCGTGACQRTVQNCISGMPQTCVPGSPTAEICNGIDDNCNGMVDEGDPGGGAACSTGLLGACAAGTVHCSGGALMCQQNVFPTAEVCNGLDDNCNGMADEGNPGGGQSCNTGQLGICAPGTTSCTSGAIVCNRNNNPTAEICNGLDDNCNGVIDDGNPGGGMACNTGQPGICAAGTTQCVSGALICQRNSNPTAEICNGLDDNCDGMIDNGAVCPTGKVCVSGACIVQNQ